MLGEIRVLILIDEHIAEIITEMLEYIGIITEQNIGIVKEIVEIHGSGNTAAVTVDFKNLMNSSASGISIATHKRPVGGIVLRRIQLIFCKRYGCRDLSGAIHLVVEMQLADYTFYERLRIGRVVYGEIRGKTDTLRIHAEKARKNGVECTHP